MGMGNFFLAEGEEEKGKMVKGKTTGWPAGWLLLDWTGGRGSAGSLLSGRRAG